MMTMKLRFVKVFVAREGRRLEKETPSEYSYKSVFVVSMHGSEVFGVPCLLCTGIKLKEGSSKDKEDSREMTKANSSTLSSIL